MIFGSELDSVHFVHAALDFVLLSLLSVLSVLLVVLLVLLLVLLVGSALDIGASEDSAGTEVIDRMGRTFPTVGSVLTSECVAVVVSSSSHEITKSSDVV